MKRSLQSIRNVNPKDVLWGNHTKHPGNKYFTSLLEEHWQIYAGEEESKREGLIDSIVEKIHNCGGRFLNKQSVPSTTPSVSSSIELDASQRKKKVHESLSRLAKKKTKAKKRQSKKCHFMPPVGIPEVVCLKGSNIDVQDTTMHDTYYTSKRQKTKSTIKSKKRLKIGPISEKQRALVNDSVEDSTKADSSYIAIPTLATTVTAAIGGRATSTCNAMNDVYPEIPFTYTSHSNNEDYAMLFFGPLLSSVSSCDNSSYNSMDSINDIDTIFSFSFDDKEVPPTTDVIMDTAGNDDNNDDDDDNISCLTPQNIFSNLMDGLDNTSPTSTEYGVDLNTDFMSSGSIGWNMNKIGSSSTDDGDKENMNTTVLGPFPEPIRRVSDKSTASSSAVLVSSTIDPFYVSRKSSSNQFQMDKHHLYNNKKCVATVAKLCSGENFMFANTNHPCVSLFMATEKEQVSTEDIAMKIADDQDQDQDQDQDHDQAMNEY